MGQKLDLAQDNREQSGDNLSLGRGGWIVNQKLGINNQNFFAKFLRFDGISYLWVFFFKCFLPDVKTYGLYLR